jgi:apolipoprotein N-acyltransferase
MALAGGLLLPLAFSPFDYSLLAILSLLLLFRSWLDVSPGRAALRGYAFGLGQFGFGVSWVYVSMHDYGGAGIPASLGLTALLVLFLALYPALTGFLATRWFGQSPPYVKLLLAFPVLWTLVEWFRGWFLTGFPWLQLGYSQLDTPLHGLAPITGVYGLSWAAALLAGLVMSLFQEARWLRRRALSAIVLLVAVAAGLSAIEWTRPAGEPFKATLLQGNIPQDTKWQPDSQKETLLLYAGMTRAHWDSKLIVWPETAAPVFYHQIRDTLFAELEAESKAHQSDLLIGIFVADLATERYYNAIISLGQQSGRYFKRHLVPFGEYLPLRPLFGFVLDLLEIPLADVSAGDAEQRLLEAAGYPLVASICYEDVLGQESRAGLPEAAYLVNVSNDAWFGNSIAAHQHFQMARMRALEGGRYLLRATNTGITALVSPMGKIINQAPQFQRVALTGEVTPMTGSTPYVRFGDGPVIVLLALVLAVALRRRESSGR